MWYETLLVTFTSEAFKVAVSKVSDKALLMGCDGYENFCEVFLGKVKYHIF